MFSQQNTIKRSWVEIDISQLEENYRIVKALLPSDAQIMGVVKADAYGHGDTVVARVLEKMGTCLFAVSNISEAILLRKADVGGAILVLGYTPVEMAELLYKYDITQALLSEEYAHLLYQSTTHKLKCQFAVDTGMNRIGLDGTDAKACSEVIRKYADLFDLNGIFTHLCVADSLAASDVAFTKRQMQMFARVAEGVSDLALPYIHCLNSAGALYHCEHEKGKAGNIIRLGIVLYGLRPDCENPLPKGIAPVLTWKTVVSMVKNVHTGESIGYGRCYTAPKKLRVATLPTGYADGYSRALSGKGYVLIRGRKAPILGRICMDQMMVDVSDIPDVALGDEAVLLGKSGNEQFTADDMAKIIGTIGYEIVCNISKRVTRVYLEN